MKPLSLKVAVLALLLLGSLEFTACKNKNKDATTTTTSVDSNNSYNNAPVQVSPDTELENGLRDATKDYPGVTATVNNGEVTLTGTIERDRLPKLMQSVHALNPKKVNNQLTVK
jgi:osmotically-inducible protein OsmY